ncbi:hypothetical protein HispidOSU_002553, partial [Sigmodon hispidus]
TGRPPDARNRLCPARRPGCRAPGDFGLGHSGRSAGPGGRLSFSAERRGFVPGLTNSLGGFVCAAEPRPGRLPGLEEPVRAQGSFAF